MAGNWVNKGSRGSPAHWSGRNSVSAKVGRIWEQAPVYNSAEQGKQVHFEPNLGFGVFNATTHGSLGGYDGLWGGDAGYYVGFGGGRLFLTTGGTDDDYIGFVANLADGATSIYGNPIGPYFPRAGTKIRMGCRIWCDDVSAADIAIGLVDGINGGTEFIAAAEDHAIVKVLAGVPTITMYDSTVGAPGTDVAMYMGPSGAAAAMSDATWHDIGFVIHGITSVDCYFDDWVIRNTTMTDLPQTWSLVPGIMVQATGNAATVLGVERWTITQDMTDKVAADYTPYVPR